MKPFTQMTFFAKVFGVASLLLIAACQEKPREKLTENLSTSGSPTASREANLPPPRYEARQFFESTSYQMASGIGWSSDNQRLLIGSDETGIFNAYRLDLTSGESEAVTSSSVDSVFPVSFFPLDQRVLYRSDRGGNERHHLFVTNPETPGVVPIDLTPGDEVRATFVRWATDGKHFYVLTNERDAKAMDLYEYGAENYARTLLFENDGSYNIVDVQLPYLALVKSSTNADADVYIVQLDAKDPSPKLITAHVGDVAHSVYTFTPDGASLIYATNENSEFREAWIYDLKTGDKSPLLSAQWDVLHVDYSNTGRYRYAYINEDASINLKMIDQESGKPFNLNLPEGSIRSVRFSSDDRHVAVLLTTDTSPADIFTADLVSGDIRRWTVALNAEIDEAHLVDSTVVRFESFDELKVPGILYRPLGATALASVPALVWVHGGPGGQSIRGYRATIQHLVNHGYAVFAANNRGSSGYGKTFFHLDDKRHGEDDLDDIVYARRYLESLDWVSNDRIGIIGGSYGGYMVGAALAFRPDVFDVGINIFGVMNWVRTLKSIPDWWGPQRDALYAELGDPSIEEDRLRRISPLFHAKNIKKPLLVIQGANDPRVLQVESDEIVAAVRANEVPVEYVLFDDEGHGFTKRENRIAASDAYLAFLEKYLPSR